MLLYAAHSLQYCYGNLCNEEGIGNLDSTLVLHDLRFYHGNVRNCHLNSVLTLHDLLAMYIGSNVQNDEGIDILKSDLAPCESTLYHGNVWSANGIDIPDCAQDYATCPNGKI